MDPGAARPQSRLAALEPRDHLLAFYDGEPFLVESVVRFLAPALRSAEGAVVVATSDHRAAVLAALGREGFDTAALRAAGQLHLVDAAALLEHLLVDGLPEAGRFRAGVEGLLAEGRPLRIFSEMGVLLWEDGNLAGLLALEGLANELAASRPLQLLCACPLRAFGREETTEAFHEICDLHTVVLPSERYSGLAEADQRHRTAAVFQREAIVGINERVALRQSLHQRDAELVRLRALDRIRERLVVALAPDPPTAERRGGADTGIEALRKTVCRQVRTALGAVACRFTPGAVEVLEAPEREDGRIAVAVWDGRTVHGMLRLVLPPHRSLDDAELDFLYAAAETLAVGFAARAVRAAR